MHQNQVLTIATDVMAYKEALETHKRLPDARRSRRPEESKTGALRTTVDTRLTEQRKKSSRGFWLKEPKVRKPGARKPGEKARLHRVRSAHTKPSKLPPLGSAKLHPTSAYTR